MSFKTAMFDSGKIGTILSDSGNKKGITDLTSLPQLHLGLIEF